MTQFLKHLTDSPGHTLPPRDIFHYPPIHSYIWNLLLKLLSTLDCVTHPAANQSSTILLFPTDTKELHMSFSFLLADRFVYPFLPADFVVPSNVSPKLCNEGFN